MNELHPTVSSRVFAVIQRNEQGRKIACSLAGCTAHMLPVSGRVVDAMTRKPVADAAVEVVGVKESKTKTNASGEFRTAPGGRHYIGVYKDVIVLRVAPGTKYHSVELRWEGATPPFVHLSKHPAIRVGDLTVIPAPLPFGAAKTRP